MNGETDAELRPSYNNAHLSIRLSIGHACPVLYRFMEDRYIDEFLDTGRLMISTVCRCRHLEDVNRRDGMESVYSYELKWKDKTNYLDVRAGDNAFVLCCSLTQSAAHDPKLTACLELHHWNQLVIEIGDALRMQKFQIAETFVGPCNYACKCRSVDMRPLMSTEIEKRGMTNVQTILERIGKEALYTTKDLRFAKEHEYRMLWLSNDAAPLNPVFVTIDHPERFGCKVPSVSIQY